MDNEEIIKGFESRILDIEKSKDQEIETLKEQLLLQKSQLTEVLDKIADIEKTPIRKSFVSENELSFTERFEKAKKEGKTIVSKDLQKSVVSNHIYNMYVESTDEFEKSILGEAISQFESANYLSPEIQKKVSDKFNIEIV